MFSGASAKRPPFLPREHGFWTMLAAVVLAALLRVPLTLGTVLAAFAVAVVAAIAGGFVRRAIRRSGAAQLVSAAALSFSGIPVELAGGASFDSMARAVGAWVPILVGSALIVRAAFARAARGNERRAPWLDAIAVALPAVTCAFFVIVGFHAEARAAGAAAAGCAALALAQPTVKQMKRVGLALASLSAVAAFALGT
jgi:hypothetical protein